MPTEDRRIGKLLPSPVTPASTVCFQIQIPNAVQYRAAFLGQINVLGQALTWDHPTDGTECFDCEEAAQLWRNAIYNATWSDDCGGDELSCADVADCIETNEAVRAAIADQITNNTAISQNVYNTTQLGTPMTEAQRNTAVGVANGDCDPDSLFGSVTAIVRQLDQNNKDFLEILQLSDNNQQRISKVLRAIPLLSESPVDEALDFASQISTEIKENYDAQYTTAVEDTIRCAIFCLYKDADPCEVTFQGLVEYFNNKIGTSLEPINFFGALVTYFVAGTWSGTTVVDIMMLIQLSAWQQASEWTGISLRTLETVGLLGANDGDSDWEILCEDCAPEPDSDCLDVTALPQKLFIRPGGYGVFTAGVGIRSQFYAPLGSWHLDVSLTANSTTGSFSEVYLEFDGTPPPMDFLYGPNGAVAGTIVGNKIKWNGPGGYWPISNVGNNWRFVGHGADSSVPGQFTIIAICYKPV